MSKSSDFFKCKNCGAIAKFSPSGQDLYCEHCESHSPFEIANVSGKNFFNPGDPKFAAPAPGDEDQLSIYGCSNCGAAINVPSNEIALACPFCGTTNIAKNDNLKSLKPDACVPFSIEPSAAETGFKAWIKKRWFVPSDLKKKVSANEIKGVYAPCYAFDTRAFGNYSGTLGKHYTRTVGSGKNRRTVTETRYFSISGNFNEFFKNIVIECGPHLDQKTLDKIRPFKVEEAKQYDQRFLSGYSADQYDTELKTGFDQAVTVIRAQLKRSILSGYNYDVVQSFSLFDTYTESAYSYMLLPVYVSNFTYRQKLFNFFVNGNTGKVTGKVPRSPWKILFAVLGALAIVAGVAILASVYGGF